MNDDARFEDGGEKPLRLHALDQEDLQVVSTLVQDAVFPITEMSWQPDKRRFGLLLNRFRWEEGNRADGPKRSFERVQSILMVSDVLRVFSNGIDRTDKDLILSLLTLEFSPGEDGAGRLELTLAGHGAIALEVECVDVNLWDVTRPYKAVAGKAPGHPE